MLSPFIHKFKSFNGNFYVYDVNTNEIVRLNQIEYDLIEDFWSIGKAEILNKWSGKYTQAELKKAINSIEVEYKKGLFSTNRPKRMRWPDGDEVFLKLINRGPRMLTLEITEQCNLRCKYCVYTGTYFYERKHSTREMPNDIINKAISFFSSFSEGWKERYITFYGGEPLLAFNKIKSVIQSFPNREQKINFTVATNGTLLNEEIINFLKKNSFIIQISLDGPTEIHDKYRVDINENPTFNRVIKNLFLIQKIDPQYYKTNVSFVITIAPGSNLLEINEFFEKNELLKDHECMVTYVNPFDTDFFKIYSPYTLEQDKQIEKLREHYIDARINNKTPTYFEIGLFEKYLKKIHCRVREKMGETISPNGACLPGGVRVFVTTYGKLHPCERVGDAFNIGDVDKGFDLYKIKEMVNNYINFSEEECLNCWAARICDMCYGSVRKNKTFDLARKKEACTVTLANLHAAFMTYATIMEKNPKAFDFIKQIVDM